MFTINLCVIYLVLYTYHKTLCFRIEFSMFEIENLSSSRMCVMDEMWGGFCFNIVVVIIINIFVTIIIFIIWFFLLLKR